MTHQELEREAEEQLRGILAAETGDFRIVQREAIAADYPDALRRISDHFFSILDPGTDLTVFFDPQGAISGWRDDGRKGAHTSIAVYSDALLKAICRELDLSADARLGEVKSVVLPPVGWTHQATVFTQRIAGASDVFRVWVDPIGLRIIQCLYGAGQ